MGAEQFKVGEIVQLKSGGPKMTVNSYHAGYYECVWFAGAKKDQSRFASETLQLYSDKKAEDKKEK